MSITGTDRKVVAIAALQWWTDRSEAGLRKPCGKVIDQLSSELRIAAFEPFHAALEAVRITKEHYEQRNH